MFKQPSDFPNGIRPLFKCIVHYLATFAFGFPLDLFSPGPFYAS